MTLHDLNQLWAIRPEAGEELARMFDQFAHTATPEQVAAYMARRAVDRGPEPLAYDVQGDGVAVFQIDGSLSKRPQFSYWGNEQVGMTYGQILSGVQSAQNDPAVRALLLAWDSPGGTVDGAQEASDGLFAMRDGKPMESVAVGQMTSAAEMVGSAAGPVWASSDTTDMGSIGVLAMHRDFSAMEEKFGIKTTLLTAGKYKGVGWGPLKAEDKAIIQEGLDHSYQIFKQTVARNRGISMDAVERMAEGRVFKGQKAVQVGLASGIATVQSRVAALSKRPVMVTNRTAFKAVAEQTTTTKQERRMTKEDLLAQYPELAASFREDGRAEGFTAGAEAERGRIKAVLEQKTPGHEAIVDAMAWDGKSTAGEAAVAVLAAQKAKTAQAASNLKLDTPSPVKTPVQASVNDNEEKPAVSGAVLANKIKAVIQEHAAKGVSITAQDALQLIRKENA